MVDSIVSATTSSFLLPVGTALEVSVGANTHIAAIAASGTTTLSVTTGPGKVQLAGGVGANASSAVTIADCGASAIGCKADAAWDLASSAATMIAVNKAIAAKVEAVRVLLGAPLTVSTHAVTQSGGPWSVSVSSAADGVDGTRGAKADTAWDLSAASPTQMSVEKAIALKVEAARALLAGTLNVAFPSIPFFKIDQTTPGTTNRVSIGTDGSVAAMSMTTTSPPSYSNGTANQLSTDTHGGLRTVLQDSAGGSIDFSYGVTSTSGSSTVTTGGTFQSALASNANRKGCLIQNPATATENLFVFFGATGSATTATSFSLPAGAAMSCATGAGFVLTDNVAITGATTGHAYILVSQ